MRSIFNSDFESRPQPWALGDIPLAVTAYCPTGHEVTAEALAAAPAALLAGKGARGELAVAAEHRDFRG